MGYTYILQCANGEYYVGSTEDLEKRLHEHYSHKGGRFTKLNQPVKLVYKEEYASYEEAFKRERQLHKWSHAKKEALVNGDINKLKELSKSKSQV